MSSDGEVSLIFVCVNYPYFLKICGLALKMRVKMKEKYLRYIRQNSKKIGIFIAFTLFLITVGILIFHMIEPNSSINPSSNTVYVSGDGTGDFNCDGEADQIEINQALKFVMDNPEYTTVYLKGPFTYTITKTVYIGNNTILTGDSDAVVKLVDDAGWTNDPMIPIIGERGDSKIENVTIGGFEIDGNHGGNSEDPRGEGYYNMIYFHDAKKITVKNMYMHDGHGDGLRIHYGENIKFYNNTIYKLGHDGFYALETKNVAAWNNTITCRTNSGLRVANSNLVKFHDNKINSYYDGGAGGPGIIIEKTTGTVNDVEIYNNTIHNTFGPGLWLIGYGSSYSREEAQNVHIHHNIFYSTGTNPGIDWVGGIVTSGFYDTLIENNVFDGVYHGAIISMYPEDRPDLSFTGTGYKTIIRNNIIVNTLERKDNPDGTGYGIINYMPENHTFVLQNNCLYNNAGGNYKNTNSTTDIYADPLFVNQRKHDYRLKAKSPCIGAGYLSPDNFKKSKGNVTQINIGRYS
jgi:hypothetical protein